MGTQIKHKLLVYKHLIFGNDKYMLILLSILIIFLSGCGVTNLPKTYADFPQEEKMAPLDGRAPILIIGDSISIGYTARVQELYPSYQVIHNPNNGRNSGYGAYWASYWVSHAPEWEYCIVNHGMWDILIDGNGNPIDLWGTTEQQYQEYLISEFNTLKPHCKKILAPNITDVPVNVTQFSRLKRDTHNIVFEQTMASLNVTVCDLYSVAVTIPHLHDNPASQNDVHFQPSGNQILGDKIKQCLDSI